MSNALPTESAASSDISDLLFDAIASDLQEKGYGVYPQALPEALLGSLWQQVTAMSPAQFRRAGIGREPQLAVNDFVRTDAVCWITGDSVAGQAWLDWSGALQHHLNRRLFMGLFSFESHFAHYAPGDFYKKHLDAFKGEANRVLSLVLYLNRDWPQDGGGELVIEVGPEETLQVMPAFGTLAVFLSEAFPHEVLPARRDRYSIAGWYRVNTSLAGRIDPPA